MSSACSRRSPRPFGCGRIEARRRGRRLLFRPFIVLHGLLAVAGLKRVDGAELQDATVLVLHGLLAVAELKPAAVGRNWNPIPVGSPQPSLAVAELKPFSPADVTPRFLGSPRPFGCGRIEAISKAALVGDDTWGFSTAFWLWPNWKLRSHGPGSQAGCGFSTAFWL